MVIVSLTRESISVFAILCNREKFSAQSEGLFRRNKRKILRKKILTYDFAEEIKKRNFR